MATVCPSITATDSGHYREQIEKVGHFARRLHIDLSDGKFAKKRLIDPEDAWWPVGVKADFHLMYNNPMPAVKTILKHRPNMIIVHCEAEGNFEQFSKTCHHQGVKAGVAVLQNTDIQLILPGLADIDHVLIFSGNLGSYGGQADLSLLSKVEILKQHKSELEVGWDGGINQNNLSQLVFGGVDILGVGGYIQNSPDPQHSFETLQRIADETGTT